MDTSPSIVWFRADLRLGDQPALTAAVQRGGPVIHLFVLPPDEEEGAWGHGRAARRWLHQSLQALSEQLAGRGSRLVLRHGPSLAVLREVVDEAGAGAVFWNRRYEPRIVERDGGIKAALRGDGLDARSFRGTLLHEPWEVSTRSGDPYRVFTPFWKSCLTVPARDPLPPPAGWPAPDEWPASVAISGLPLDLGVPGADRLTVEWGPPSSRPPPERGRGEGEVRPGVAIPRLPR